MCGCWTKEYFLIFSITEIIEIRFSNLRNYRNQKLSKLVLSLDAFIASKERIFLWISFWLRLSIFYSFRVCVRQISHVRNERHSENSTTRDWWIIETSLTLLIYHFSDFHLFQDKKLILFWSGRWWKSYHKKFKKFYSWKEQTKVPFILNMKFL